MPALKVSSVLDLLFVHFVNELKQSYKPNVQGEKKSQILLLTEEEASI